MDILEDEMKFGTHEWASHTVNILNGCHHDCKYCYSKEMAVRFKRNTVDGWKEEKLNSLKFSLPRKTDLVMFPSSHDLSPKFLKEEIQIIEQLLSLGKKVLLVSKPHLKVIQEICRRFPEHKDNLLFRFSIGSISESVLKYWEPNAPGPQERISALETAFSNGFQTSLSLEPILDTNTIILIQKTSKYVNEKIWIGKPNFLLRRIKMNGFSDNSDEYQEAKRLIKAQSDEYILDLYEKLRDNSKIEWKESIKKTLLSYDKITSDQIVHPCTI